LRRDGQTSTTWKGLKMQRQLNTAELEVEIGTLIELHTPSDNPLFGFWRTSHSTRGRVRAAIHVDERFTGDHVIVTDTKEFTDHTIEASGSNLGEALNDLWNRLLESAPSYEIQRGA
jgi:hypothetical protein